jgi:class 3 adenylate cyclase
MTAPTLRELIERWQRAREEPASLAEGEPVDLARSALQLGHPTLACEILRVCGVDENGSTQARYLSALAHARVGASARSLSMALSLLDDPGAAPLHIEALALIGRLAKDRWSRLDDGAEREHAGRQAIDCYRRAWELSGDAFPGVNAATMLHVTGEADTARELAARVRGSMPESPAAATAHWHDATLGELALLLGETEAAQRHYSAAATSASGRVGDVASMRRQLRLLEPSLPAATAVLESILVQPRIVVFTGHMIDAPDRHVARLPEAIEDALAARLAQRLDALGAGFGYSSAACGADLLFIEAMLARGAEVHVTLPFDRGDFLATSVAFAGPHWVERFERALARASSVSYGVRERYLGDESLYAYAGGLMQGAAVLRGRELESEPMLLAVVDPDSERLPGGTRDMIENWRRLGRPLERIDPAPLREVAVARSDVRDAAAAPTPDVALRSAALRREVRTMLFADMVGFSRLEEEDTPSFLVHFLGAISDMVRDCGHAPSFVNTWGDGLFMVFAEVEHGADFALRLRDAVRVADWPAHGLPAGTDLRIGMHTGPVFEAPDPLIGRRNYFGSHVIRAARIEPVAAPGSVYVSAELAFALAASGGAGFATDYLGQLPLAKGFGSGPLYRLRRARASE